MTKLYLFTSLLLLLLLLNCSVDTKPKDEFATKALKSLQEWYNYETSPFDSADARRQSSAIDALISALEVVN
jgi:hypothetical protein